MQNYVLVSLGKSLFGAINLPSLEVPELELTLKRNADLSRSVLQDTQTVTEAAKRSWRDPRLLSSAVESGAQKQLYLFRQAKTLFISTSSEPTHMMGRQASSCDPAGVGVAAQVRGARHLLCNKSKQQNSVSSFPQAGQGLLITLQPLRVSRSLDQSHEPDQHEHITALSRNCVPYFMRQKWNWVLFCFLTCALFNA